MKSREFARRHRGGAGGGGQQQQQQQCQDTKELMESMSSQLKVLVERETKLANGPKFEYLRADPLANQVRGDITGQWTQF